MKLTEIVIRSTINPSNLNIISNHIDSRVSGGYGDIWIINIGAQKAYCIIIENKIVSYLIGQDFSNADIKRGFIVQEVYVRPEFRKKGYASTLYEYLYRDKRVTIVSDEYMSKDGQQIWIALRKQFNDRVKIYDTITSELVSFDSIAQDVLYKDTRYRLILTEQADNLFERTGIPTDRGCFFPPIPFTPTELGLDWI